MGTYQKSYENSIPKGQVGHRANTGDGFWKVDNRKVEGSAIGFGLATSNGATDGSVILGGTDFIGVSLANTGAESGGNLDQTETNWQARIVSQGEIWVAVKKVVAVGDSVFYDNTTGEFGLVSGDTNATELTSASYTEGASAGEIAKLRINL